MQHPLLFLLGPFRSNKDNGKHTQKGHFQQNWETYSEIFARSPVHTGAEEEEAEKNKERCQQQQISKSTKGRVECTHTDSFLKDAGPVRGKSTNSYLQTGFRKSWGQQKSFSPVGLIWWQLKRKDICTVLPTTSTFGFFFGGGGTRCG